MEIIEKIRIPRDPRYSELRFLEFMPISVEDKIDVQTYKECIESINEVFKPRYSLFYIIKLLSIILFLVSEQSSYDEEVEKIIKKVNNKIKNTGLKFGHPKDTNYLELVLYIQI